MNDTYNSNPLSSRYALRSVSEIFPERRKIAVLSDMKELGDEALPVTGIPVNWLPGRDSYAPGLGRMAGEYLEGAAREGSTMEGHAALIPRRN